MKSQEMEKSLTKDYIINNKKYIFPFHLEGISYNEIIGSIKGLYIKSYAIPIKHSTKSAWLLRILFSKGFYLEFSSTPNDIGGWEEMGSLNIKLIKNFSKINNNIFIHKNIENFKVKEVFKLVHATEEIFSNSGIVFVSEEGKEIIIVCGVSPGSVSMKTPDNSVDKLDAELDLSDYKKINWSNG